MRSLATGAPDKAGRLGGWPLPTTGGRPRIARGPNQGVFCSRVRRHSKTVSVRLRLAGLPRKPRFQTGFWVRSVGTKGWRPAKGAPAL